MISKMKLFCSQLILLLFLISCNQKQKICQPNKIEPIKNILNDTTIINNYFLIQNEKYIIYPYFKKFGFDDFIVENYPDVRKFPNKKLILKEAGITNSQLINDEKYINDLFYNKKCDRLYDFSTGEKSHYIIRFSGISDRLIFADAFSLKREVGFEDLVNDFHFKKNMLNWYQSYVVILNKDGSYKKIENINGMYSGL